MLRGALVVVALAQLIITLPLLLLGTHDLQRDMGASNMAMCVAFLAVAWRPGRAVAISPVVGTAAGLLIIAVLIDLAGGEASLVSEAPHVAAVIGWLLVREVAITTPPTIEAPDRPLIRLLRRAFGAPGRSAHVLATHEPVSRHKSATAQPTLESTHSPADEYEPAEGQICA